MDFNAFLCNLFKDGTYKRTSFIKETFLKQFGDDMYYRKKKVLRSGDILQECLEHRIGKGTKLELSDRLMTYFCGRLFK